MLGDSYPSNPLESAHCAQIAAMQNMNQVPQQTLTRTQKIMADAIQAINICDKRIDELSAKLDEVLIEQPKSGNPTQKAAEKYEPGTKLENKLNDIRKEAEKLDARLQVLSARVQL